MRDPHVILEEILELISPLAFETADADTVYPAISSRIDELRGLNLDGGFLESLNEKSRVLLDMDPGDKCANVSSAICDIEEWREENKFWFGHL